MIDLSRARRNPFAPGLFEGLVAIVTGGGTGIGRATAERILELGGKVVIASRDPAHYEAPLAEMAKLGEVMAARCDIRDPVEVEKLVAGALERFGRIDVLVNNAGGQFLSPAEMMSPKGWEAVIRNNLNGTFFMTREVAVKAMIPAKRGSIVNVTAGVWRGFPAMAHTGAARAGVENMTMTLAVEWAQHDVRVNTVAPGNNIRSSGTERYPPESLEVARQETPQKRLGTVEEIANAIVFLASPASAFTTGVILRVDGGQALWGDVWPIPERDPSSIA